MYELINKITGGNIVTLRISGELSDKENEELEQLLKKRAEESGNLRLFLILKGYPAADSAESLYEDLRFVKLSAEKIERMAVVGDKAWQETWIALFGLFGRVETSYFEYADADRAEKWLKQ